MNFKPYFYILLCGIINNSCIAQTYFNHFYTQALINSNIKATNNGYVATFITNLHGIEHYMTKLDTNGNIISNIQIIPNHPNIGGLGTFYNSLSNKKNGKYIFAGISDDSTRTTDRWHQPRLTGEIICINEDFDSVLWQKSYQYQDSLTRYFKSQWLPNSNILIGGDVGFGFNNRLILTLTDSLGNKRWERDFTQQVGYNLYFDDMAATPDGGFLLSATNLLFTGDNSDGLSAQAVLIKVDSLGNQQWRKIWGRPNIYDGHVAIYAMPNGNILTINQKGLNPHTIQYGGYYPWSTLHFRVWDLNGTLLNSKNMVQEYGAASQYTSIITRPNGNFGVVHYKHSNQIGANIYGYFEFTPALDSVKCRYFPNTFNPLPVYDWSVVGAIDNTADGGLVFSGYHFCNNGCIVNPGQQAWVMKLDSNACEITDCYSTSTESPPLGDLGGLRLFPNPAQERTRLVWDEPLHITTSLHITNSIGQVVKSITVEKGFTYQDIEVKDLPNGLYFVSLQTQTVKFIKVE
jgi:Secretion system C-terminal sorting domain